jgi:hypothetical protein
MTSRDHLATVLARNIGKREKLTRGARTLMQQYLNADTANVAEDDCDEKLANAVAKALNDWTAAYDAAWAAYDSCMAGAKTQAEKNQCGDALDDALYNADWDQDTAEIEAAAAWIDCWSKL